MKELDAAWILFSATLVFSMQAGFCCLESGFVRAKNSINVALKNLVDFFVSTLLFWAVGFGLMFGTSLGGWIGTDQFTFAPTHSFSTFVFFLFQLAFCSTSATIVSGAVAERMRFAVYLLCAAMVSGLIYPIFGHWAWARDASGNPSGWLGQLGFHDFAGSSVVHSVGGWVALACILRIGPRMNRFKSGSNTGVTQASNLSLAVLGAFILLFGWLGFNGGSTLAFNSQIPSILLVTLLGASSGSMMALILSWFRQRNFEIQGCINGCLAGLVAVTAGCDVLSPVSAIIAGATGCIVTDKLNTWMIQRKWDDAVGAVPVHMGAGIWGTLLVALLGHDLGRPWWQQLPIQLLGIITCGLWSFGVAYLIMGCIAKTMKLRVSPQEEYVGLNVAEHGASTEILDLIQQMESQRAAGDFSKPIEGGDLPTEIGQITRQYNRVLTKVQQEAQQAALLNQQLKVAKNSAEAGLKAKSQFLSTMSHELRTPLNAVIGFSNLLQNTPLDNDQQEFVKSIRDSGERLLDLVREVLEIVDVESGTIELHPASIQIQDIATQAIASLQDKAASKSLHFITHFDPHAPRSLISDPARVAQVISLLLDNAIKFTDAGEITLQIIPSREAVLPSENRPMMVVPPPAHQNKTEQYVAVIVSDTGSGIPLPSQAEIFQHFFQSDSSHARKHGGSGLGLAICKGLIHRLGGAIGFSSQPGQGSTFWFTLPVTESVEEVTQFYRREGDKAKDQAA